MHGRPFSGIVKYNCLPPGVSCFVVYRRSRRQTFRNVYFSVCVRSEFNSLMQKSNTLFILNWRFCLSRGTIVQKCKIFMLNKTVNDDFLAFLKERLHILFCSKKSIFPDFISVYHFIIYSCSDQLNCLSPLLRTGVARSEYIFIRGIQPWSRSNLRIKSLRIIYKSV